MVLWLNVWNKELLTLRNFFVVNKKFLKAKFDCTSWDQNWNHTHVWMPRSGRWRLSIRLWKTSFSGQLCCLWSLFCPLFFALGASIWRKVAWSIYCYCRQFTKEQFFQYYTTSEYSTRTVRPVLSNIVWNFYFLLLFPKFSVQPNPALIKLNYRKKVFYFALNFLPWEFLLIKKLDFEKTKAT